MKTFVKNSFYALFSLFLFVACSEVADIASANKQLDELKAAQVATVNTQMTNIQNSIKGLEKVDTDLNSLISSLQTSLEDIDGGVDGMEKIIGRLEGADATLKQRIKDLKAYCEDTRNNVTEWTTTTYATLQKQNTLLTEIAGLKDNLLSELMLSVSSLNTSYSKIASDRAKLIAEIEGIETSMKGWVNEQLTGYYTIAQVNAKLKALEDSYKAGDELLSTDISTLRQDLETAKTDLTTAYKAAIAAAITENNGTINQKIADGIKTATDTLQKQLDDLSGRLEAVEERLTALEASVAKLINMVQSVVVVPDYSDGSVLLSKVKDNKVRFEVYPLDAAAAIAETGPSILSLDYVGTLTKSSEDFVNLPITAVSFTGKTLLLTVDGTSIPEDILTGSSSANARLKISDGTNTRTSEYFPIYKQGGGSSQPQTGVAITGESVDIGETSAKLYGWCYQDSIEGASAVYGIEYSATDLTTAAITLTAEEKDTENKYFCQATGLSFNTQYYYRAFTLYNGVRTYGDVKSFKTADFSATVTTLSASDITELKATLNGTLSVVSEDELLKFVWFLYSDTATTLDAMRYTGSHYAAAPLAEDGSFQCQISSLNSNTTYYYVAGAYVQGREVFGEVKSFNTKDFSAAVTCYSENVDKTTATISGALIVTSKETLSQSVTLYYGTKNSSADELMSNGQRMSISLNQDGNFSTNLSSLANGTTYYYAAVANVYDKTFNSDVKSFTTLTPNCPSGAVNLGLSVCWASCNLGASSPEQRGNLYAWGETETKTSFGWNNYKWAEGSDRTLTKYNWNAKYGVVDNLVVLETGDDAAKKELGNSWRIPSAKDYLELARNCDIELQVINGVKGLLFTSKFEGYKSNSIFLPFDLDRYDHFDDWQGGNGRYWTNALYSFYNNFMGPDWAEVFDFNCDGEDDDMRTECRINVYESRETGHCIRAVVD